ncbi:hypothetical protein A6J76_011340 [Aggregatibacter aphrophilus]|nr:hypothetical protein A6J76_011340 [Aggregatibacter aphrophilus]
MIKHITEHFRQNLPVKFTARLTALLACIDYCMVSYTPLDSSWATSSFAPETINKAGALGAWFVDLFLFFSLHR